MSELTAENKRRIRQRLKDDYPHYSSKCLKIRSKSGDINPFVLNKAQMFLHEKIEDQRRRTGKVRAVVLKGRQQGCSTYIEGRFYWKVTHRFGVRAFILTHDAEATNNLFEMAKRYHDYCPDVVRPSIQASNSKELVFGVLDSGYKLGTAGNKAVGRSSTIQLLHGSEVAYWPNAIDHAKGILQAVPNNSDTEIFFESTANGVGNYFHEQWQLAEAGQSDFIPIFIPWYWQEEYLRNVDDEFVLDDEEQALSEIFGLSDEQLNWRRYKIVELSAGGTDGIKAFKQEYPCTAIEAFQISGEDNFIDSSVVLFARKCEVEAVGALIIGVDPARFGDDRSSIIFRRGRKAFDVRSFIKKDTMEIAGIVHNIILEKNPDKVCIDVVGLGAGVYDRLKELGHEKVIVAVNGGSTPLDANKYFNKRAENWALMKEWLSEQPVEIPDIDTLHADLCNIRYTFDSRGRLVMEKKQDMKKRGIRSPDEADALALTFAIPFKAVQESRKKQEENVANVVMGQFIKLQNLRRNSRK